MRISILGNSDTTGRRLAPGEKPWPALIEERLRESLGGEVVVDSWRFAPYRPHAVDYALGLVAEAEPDVAITTLASYWCAYSTMQTRIERRLGTRAAALVQRAERGFARRLEPRRKDGGGRRRQRLVRRVVRKVVGTESLLSVSQFIETYSELVRELSKRESMEVLVLSDHHFNERMRRTMPGIEPAIAAIEAAIRPLVEERRLHWGDLEQTIGAAGRREEMILPDGVHMTLEAHERVAAALAPLLESMHRD